jgi:hypothetical protein
MPESVALYPSEVRAGIALLRVTQQSVRLGLARLVRVCRAGCVVPGVSLGSPGVPF